jgi:hypothetical protein
MKKKGNNMSTYQDTQVAGTLAIDIMRRGYHQPLIDGKSNRPRVHDNLIRDIMSGQLEFIVTEDIVELALDTIDDLIWAKMNNIGPFAKDSDK